jgi:CheY-like chemotaxis protein
MEKIFIINNQEVKNVESDNITYINIASEELLTDWHFHDYAVNIIKKYKISRLVIPLAINGEDFKGLTLGMHIRLNNNLSHEEKSIPILFSSERHTFETIFSNPTLPLKSDRSLPHYLLTTPNIYLEKSNLNVIRKVFESSKPMSRGDYKNKFLNVIKILPTESNTKHSLANLWGAFQLAKVTNNEDILANNKSLLNKQKDIYFQYVEAQTAAEVVHEKSDSQAKSDLTISSEENVNKLAINATGKNILLIDDEAQKGWDVVLESIFQGCNQFESVAKSESESFKDYRERVEIKVGETDENQLPRWDLILLDLRLDELEDKGENANKLAHNYSGAEILQKIKKSNEGTQVIMFTASNKAWNMKNLLDLGADGYYIKESPEFNFSSNFTTENYINFQNEVEQCFEKGFLRNISERHKRYIESISDRTESFYERSKIALEIAFELLKKSAKEKKYFNLAYLTYYQILEDYSDMNRNFDFFSKSECYVGINKLRVIDGRKWKLKYIEGKKGNPSHFEKTDFLNTRDASVQYLAKISFILAFQFNKSNTDLKKFGFVTDIRNEITAHSGNKGVVTYREILNLLTFVDLVLS